MIIKEFMTRNVITVGPEINLLDAHKIMLEKKIRKLPVIDKGKLVGIVTESDIVRFLIHVLGIDEEGSRITITGLKRKLDQLEKIISIIDEHKIKILSMVVPPRRDKAGWMLALRLSTKKPKTIVQT